MTIPISQIYSSESKKFDSLKEELMFRMHCCMPCVVQAYDAEKQTVDCQPLVRERIIRETGQIQYVQYPLLINVPVVQYTFGSAKLRFPIKEGDECLVIFSDLAIDNWWIEGSIQNPVEQRRHDLSDGFAIFGITNLKKQAELDDKVGHPDPPVGPDGKEGIALYSSRSGEAIFATDTALYVQGYLTDDEGNPVKYLYTMSQLIGIALG